MNVIACVPLESFSSLDFLLKDHSHFVVKGCKNALSNFTVF